MKEIEFTLTSPVTYHDAGNPNAECYQLILVAPCQRQVRLCAILKQGFCSQMLKMQDRKDSLTKLAGEIKKEDQKEISPSEVLAILYMSDLDLIKYFDTFTSLCTGGSVKLPDGKFVTAPILEKMSVEDFENMLGTYLINFILGSLLQMTKVT